MLEESVGARGVDGLGRLVVLLFAAHERNPVTFEQFHALVSSWLRDNRVRLQRVN